MKKKEIPPIEPYRYSERVSLMPGDKIRVKGGPYFLTDAGVQIYMGERGVFTFKSVTKDGILAVAKGGGVTFIYTGDERISDLGTHLQPHKISKVRKKK